MFTIESHILFNNLYFVRIQLAADKRARDYHRLDSSVGRASDF